MIERDLKSSGADGLDPDWAMSIAYNAALQAGAAALAAEGYRAGRDSHHYRVIQSLRLTLETDVATVDRLNTFRKKRNLSGYERAGQASSAEAEDMRELATKLRDDLLGWLEVHHPEFV